MKLRITIIAALMAMLGSTAIAQSIRIQHVEPQNWWVGFKNPTLQLMIHAKDIAKTSVTVDYPGVTLEQTIAVQNPNYLFLDLNIASNTAAGTVPIKFMLKNKVVATLQYELKARAEGSAERIGFSSQDAMMLVMPDRFVNADPSNDDVPSMLEKSDRNAPYGRHGGDLAGIAQHLDYFTDLGMTALWLNPIQENNMPQSSYHGYAITDYSNVDARFGTNADFKALVEKCHEKGLKVIMDMVFNHCGSNHWWMHDLPCASWLNQSQENHDISNFRLSTQGDPHVAQVDLDRATRAWFDHSMPDMNLTNPLVCNYFIQNSMWWVEEFGLDGIRQDTYPYPDKHAMTMWNVRINDEYPNFNMVGETWISSTAKVSYWQKDAHNADGYNSELKTIMDFPLRDAICAAFNENVGWDTGLQRLYDVLADDYHYANTNNLLVFAENHDCGRFLHTMQGDVRKQKMATAFLAAVRGIPQLYIGSEVLMDGDGAQHSEIRKDFPGGWAGDELNFFTARPEREDDMYQYTAKVFNFRKTCEAIHNGTLLHYLPQNNLYVLFRQTEKENVMLILNATEEARVFDAKHYAEGLRGMTKGQDIISDQNINVESLSIPAMSAMLIKLIE
ncbi:MAG: glycoside hydrolase family 13 protein [Bacteroidia bacterium]|nr:glycoside hydrolase family 13 protein [Bacteroidia bacterium]